MMHTNEPIKESFKSQVEAEQSRNRRRPCLLTNEEYDRKKAQEQVEKFLGRHLITHEPFGLVF